MTILVISSEDEVHGVLCSADDPGGQPHKCKRALCPSSAITPQENYAENSIAATKDPTPATFPALQPVCTIVMGQLPKTHRTQRSAMRAPHPDEVLKADQ